MTLAEALSRLFSTAGVDASAFFARHSRQAAALSKTVEDAGADAVIALAYRARQAMAESVPADHLPDLDDILAELIGVEELLRRNVAVTATETAHSGLADAMAGSHEHRFLSLTANVPGHLVAYWAVLGTGTLPYVSHQSIELFCNMDPEYSIDFQYYRDAVWSALGEERTAVVVAPSEFTIFDGRAPHRHLVLGGERAASLVVQFAQGPAFTDAVAFASAPPGADEGREEGSLSFGVEPQNVQFRELVGKRLRGVREAYGRTLDDVMRLVAFRQAARTGESYSGSVSGSARVKLSRTESGMEKLPLSWLLELCDALDTPVRQMAMYPSDIMIQVPTRIPDAAAALLPPSYFFTAGPAAAYEACTITAADLHDHFRAVPGECLIVPFSCCVTLDLVVQPASFRLRNKSHAHGAVVSWDHPTINNDEVYSHEAQPGPVTNEADAGRRALYFRGDLPHRVRSSDKNGVLLVIGHRSVVGALGRKR